MVQLPDQKNLAVSEKILEVAESLQQVPRYLYVILAVVVVVAVPVTVILQAVFFNLLQATYTPPSIVYVAPQAKPLEVADKKIFSAGDGAYYAYARVSNVNPDLGIRVLQYRFSLADGQAAKLGSFEAITYVLPGQERLLFMPAQKFASQPTSVQVTLLPERWSKIGNLRTLNFAYEQTQFGVDATGHFYVSGVMRNENPYIIPTVELGVILYNLKHEAVGANFTVLNQIQLDENRFFRVIWPLGVTYAEVTNVEFKASVNQLERGSLLTEKITPDNYYDFMR